MLGLFKKKNRNLLSELDFEFLNALANKLVRYDFKSQINRDFIVGKRSAMLSERKGSFTYIFNAELEERYTRHDLPELFLIKGILVTDNITNKKYPIELYVMKGILIAYYCEKSISTLDLDSIDTSSCYEKHFKNEEVEQFIRSLGKLKGTIEKELDLNGIFKIEITEGEFYVIKTLGDGNYLAMDSKGAVYVMIHDPYEVEKLFETKETFFKALEEGEFDIAAYYEQKMSQ